MTDLTKIDTPFGKLDRETKGALLLAQHEGAEIEVAHPDNPEKWTAVLWGTGLISELIYRVKPVPLTPDTIDWSQVVEGWDWLARDSNGTAYFYSSEPSAEVFSWTAPGNYGVHVTQSSYVRGTCDWKDSLLIRPGKE